MTERITREFLDNQIKTLNLMMEKQGSRVRYGIDHSSYYTLERLWADGTHVATLRGGTKNELSSYVYCMMNVLWDLEVK